MDAPADVDEPSLSVSVVFEPDALPAGLLAGVPSPLGASSGPDSDVVPSPTIAELAPPTQAEAPASDVPATLADAAPPESASTPAASADGAPDDGGFFDDALANFPTATLGDEAADDAGASVRPPADSFVDVAVDEVELVDAGPAHRVDDEGLVSVPPPPEDDDDDATLVRLPTSQAAPVVAAATASDDLTPAQTRLDPARSGDEDGPSGGGRKKKSTRRRAKDKTAATITDTHDVIAARREPATDAAAPNDAPASGRARGDDDPAVGRRIADGKYVIESLIGSGAAGAVYRATHRELRRTVAIKLLHPHYQQDPQFMTSFRGEALAASQLDHPNVMRVLDFDQEPDGLIYIVMEYLSGRTLQSLLDEERRLPTERAVEIMIQVCAALSVAHDHGIIHRDIKPDNIMLVPSRDDEGATFELVKVCDFGIAALQNPRAEDADLAATEHVIAGTPEYMSPEQARGTDVDARSDVYACGICLYELVTGRPPFLGDNPAEILIKQLEEVPKPPSHIIKGLDPIVEEVILRAVQKDPAMRHQSAREMRVELKELIDPGDGYANDDQDELSIVENLCVLDDPASGFPGFFIAFSSAILRFGRFERGHHEAAQAMKELSRTLRIALRGRSELTFARRDVQKTISFVVMTGTAEIVDLRRLLGSQLYGSFGEPFIAAVVNKGIAALTLREGIPDVELHYIVEMLLGPFAGEDLRRELLSKPLRYVSVLFVTDVVGRDRKLSWKVGLGASRLVRDLLALCNVRGISLKKMRETRDELVGGVARLLTRGDEVKQFIFNADLVDEAVANLRGFSSFQVAPLIIDRVLHESCAEAATILLADHDAGGDDDERTTAFLHLFAQRLVTERSPRSDAAVAELYRRKIVDENEMPRDLKESIRAQTLADALVREPSQFLITLDLIGDPGTYESELATLEAAMATLARRAEAAGLLAVMSTLARHAKGAGKAGPRETAALRTMKSMIDKQRLLPIATTLLVGPAHQREAARQLIVIAGSVGASALYTAREATLDPAARPIFVQVLRDTGPAGWALLSHLLPHMEVRDDAELALVEDLLRAVPDRPDPGLGEAVAKFLAHPLLRPTALAAIVPLWGERAKKPLVEALEYADEPTRILALGELRRLRAIDEYVLSVLERFLTMRGSAGEELRASAAAALADVSAPLRTRVVQLLSKAVEGKRGLVAMLRGSDNNDESVVVMEAMGRALLALDRAEGVRALKGRLSRSEGLMKARLSAVLQMG
ncbi:MAG: protein kinase [Labilithrix sp.]|nr:protein kinase [Labilithrix sp.]